MRITLIAILAMFALTAYAADVDGKWKASFTTPDGTTRESTFDLKAEGSTLTGKVIGTRGETPIQEGKINGNEVSFSVVRKFNDQEFKMQYKGKIAGNEMKLTVSAGEREFEMTAKKM